MKEISKSFSIPMFKKMVALSPLFRKCVSFSTCEIQAVVLNKSFKSELWQLSLLWSRLTAQLPVRCAPLGKG